MAYAQTINTPLTQCFHDVHTLVTSPTLRRSNPKQRFVAELSQCLLDFVVQLLPTPEEMTVKEDVRKLLERLIRTIEPDSRLLSFGSTANGFNLRNSDMDLCCLIDSEERLSASDLVTMLGDLLERETKFHVKTLPHARIPIVKLSLDPSPGLPLGIACDIGFENRLALENTRLLMCYAMIDPTRVRTMVLFLKVWSKRRKINSPYKGTLSSYGYVLLVIYFLVHVKNPPVLPNLQQIPPLRSISKEDYHLNGYNIWFFDDIELLRQRWRSENTESVAELLIDFFRYYSRDFLYNTGVVSIRTGLLKKESKGWQNDLSGGRYSDARDRNRFCVEDPFEVDFNVARCVTKDGLYTIRGEFMRASRVLAARPERAILALAELCEERPEETLNSPPPFGPRLSALPPQTPYTVGSNSIRHKAAPLPTVTSPTKLSEGGPRCQAVEEVPSRSPPEHMAPKRGKWTSPPPPEASPDDHHLFESQLGKGLELATSSTPARESANTDHSSSNSEILTDDEVDTTESDDVRSIQSFTEGTNTNSSKVTRRSSLHIQDTGIRIAPPPQSMTLDPTQRAGLNFRRRVPRPLEKVLDSNSQSLNGSVADMHVSTKAEVARRSLSGPPRAKKAPTWNSHTPLAVNTPLPPSPDSPSPHMQYSEPSTVYYQTTVTRSPRPTVLYPSSGTHSSFLSQYQQAYHFGHISTPNDIFPSNHPPSLIRMSSRGIRETTGWSSAGPDTPTPTSHLHSSHSHSHSVTTITAPTPPPHTSIPSQPVIISSPIVSQSPTQVHSRSPSLQDIPPAKEFMVENTIGNPSPTATTSVGSESPTPSSTGYATSMSRSPSPSPPPTVTPPRPTELSPCIYPPSSLLQVEDGVHPLSSMGSC